MKALPTMASITPHCVPKNVELGALVRNRIYKLKHAQISEPLTGHATSETNYQQALAFGKMGDAQRAVRGCRSGFRASLPHAMQ